MTKDAQIPSSQPVRIREIAARAQCTKATVSMALNGNPRLPELTRQRIQEIAREMGYVPNQLAKSLSLGRTSVLGVVLPMAIDPYYAAILDALNQEASNRNYQLLIQFHRWSVDEEEKALRQLAKSRVDGILLYPARSSYQDLPLAKWLDGVKVPIVLLSDLGGTGLPSIAGRVVKDRQQASTLVMEEFARLGHRRLDILHPRFSNAEMPQRYAPLLNRDLSRRMNLDARVFSLVPEMGNTDPHIQQHGLSPSRDEDLLLRYIESYLDWPERGSAVMTSNHRVAWKLLSTMRRKHLHCPEDLSVISVGILGAGNDGAFPLTAVEYDAKEIARIGLDLMLNRINNHLNTGDAVVTAELVRRESAAEAPCSSVARNTPPASAAMEETVSPK
ncbi:MAG TPA: LacI family DNA-binding transcriptional regulator [Chthoniobacteraceae bacterium]|nr:LacI family DNA-binding transcriptional regulator [Chthoniobacteraceae bacterium]